MRQENPEVTGQLLSVDPDIHTNGIKPREITKARLLEPVPLVTIELRTFKERFIKIMASPNDLNSPHTRANKPETPR